MVTMSPINSPITAFKPFSIPGLMMESVSVLTNTEDIALPTAFKRIHTSTRIICHL